MYQHFILVRNDPINLIFEKNKNEKTTSINPYFNFKL